jgi:hypothetical protein
MALRGGGRGGVKSQTLAWTNAMLESFLQHHGALSLIDDVPASSFAQQTLSDDELLEIGSTVLQLQLQETEDLRARAQRQSTDLNAQIEACHLAAQDARKVMYEFKRDAIAAGENPRTGKIAADKVLRYMDDKLLKRAMQLEKLAHKNAALKKKNKKAEQNLHTKDDTGDVLHYIDFTQLKIENKQCVLPLSLSLSLSLSLLVVVVVVVFCPLMSSSPRAHPPPHPPPPALLRRHAAKIDERNQSLLKLKMTTGKSIQALNNLKKHLHGMSNDEEWLRNEIAERIATLQRTRDECARTRAKIIQLHTASRKLDSLSPGSLAARSKKTSNMPQVIDYVKQKKEVFELERAVANWQRQVDLAMLARKQASRTQLRKTRLAKQGVF